MDLKNWQTRPSWEQYEAELLDRGFQPYWNRDIEAKLSAAGITCCSCRSKASYVGMTDGKTELGFLACGPECRGWMWFLAADVTDRQGSDAR